MPVPSADPDAVRLTDAFKTAMEGPAKPREVSPPPEIDQDAPHGRDPESGDALAPFGLTRDGKPRKSAAGRKAKDAAPRIEKLGASTPGKTPAKSQPVVLEAKDFTKPLTEAGDGVWVCMSSVAKLPILPGRITDAVGAEAAIFHSNQAQLAGALNTAAQHNPRARKLAEKLSQGDVSWVLTCFSMTAPFLVQTALLFKPGAKPEGFPAMSELAAKNDRDLGDYVEAMMLLQQGDLAAEPPVPEKVAA
jgi:hypothetical protein